MRKATISGKLIHYNVSNGSAIVRPECACDAEATEALATLVNSEIIGTRDLVLDLSRCPYVETPGYRWLVRQLRQLESAGRTLIVVGMLPSVARVFKLLHFDRMIPVAKDVPEAMDRLQHGTEKASVS